MQVSGQIHAPAVWVRTLCTRFGLHAVAKKIPTHTGNRSPIVLPVASKFADVFRFTTLDPAEHKVFSGVRLSTPVHEHDLWRALH
jgi:hypothetical protein